MTVSRERRKGGMRNPEARRLRNRRKRGIIDVPNGPTIGPKGIISRIFGKK